MAARAGSGESFWQFRPFVAGEAAARIDWRRSARDDRLYVREREWEATHNIWFWIDRSASMGFASDLAQAPKWSAPWCWVSRSPTPWWKAASARASSGSPAPPPRGGSSRPWPRPWRRMRRAGRRRPPAATPGRFDEAVLISDFLIPPEAVKDSVDRLAGRGTRGHLVMIVDPVEETFPFGAGVLHDVGSALRLHVGDAGAWGETYRVRIARPPGRLAEIARAQGWTLTIHRTDRPASEAALRLLTLLAAARGTG